MRPSFLPDGSRIPRPPAPPQKTLPALSTFMPSGTPLSLPPRSANTLSVCFANRPFGCSSNTRMWRRRESVLLGRFLLGGYGRQVGWSLWVGNNLLEQERRAAVVHTELQRLQ